MQNRTPIPREERPPLPDFDPVPRKCARHDGWTPERQRAFIEALADTGSVDIAARQVNMSTVGAYYLRRQPGAEGFRRAWEAALDMGVQRLKDIAFERAIYGTVEPVFINGRQAGFRRRYNDRLLMFCLRHYTNDPIGRRVTVNYQSSKATATAAPNPPRHGEGDRAQRGGGVSQNAPTPTAHAETTTVRTTVTSPAAGAGRAAVEDEAAAVLNAFHGIPLDAQAQAEIVAALERAAVRRRALEEAAGTADPDAAAPDGPAFIRTDPARGLTMLGPLEPGVELLPEPFVEGEAPWATLGPGGWAEKTEEALAQLAASRAAAPQLQQTPPGQAPPEPAPPEPTAPEPAPPRRPPPRPAPPPPPAPGPEPDPAPQPKRRRRRAAEASFTQIIQARFARIRLEQEERIAELRHQLANRPPLTLPSGAPIPTPAELRRMRRKGKE